MLTQTVSNVLKRHSKDGRIFVHVGTLARTCRSTVWYVCEALSWLALQGEITVRPVAAGLMIEARVEEER